MTWTHGQFVTRLREHFSDGVQEANAKLDTDEDVMAIYDRAALRTIVEAHEPQPEPPNRWQRAVATRRANQQKREKEQTKAALANANGKDATLNFPGSPTGAA